MRPAPFSLCATRNHDRPPASCPVHLGPTWVALGSVVGALLAAPFGATHAVPANPHFGPDISLLCPLPVCDGKCSNAGSASLGLQLVVAEFLASLVQAFAFADAFANRVFGRRDSLGDSEYFRLMLPGNHDNPVRIAAHDVSR